MNKEEKERLQLVADYAETEKNTLLMRLRIFSIVGLVSLIAGLVMLVLGGDNNLPVYDYLMGTLMGVSMVAVFYSTGALENMRKRKRTLMKVLLVISILFLLGTFIAAIIASLLYIY